jgi:hypothetical protein
MSDDVFRRKVEEERAFRKAADMGTVMISTDVAFACDPIKFPHLLTVSYNTPYLQAEDIPAGPRRFGDGVPCQGGPYLKRKWFGMKGILEVRCKMFRQGPQSWPTLS